jgi:predicted MarR family transcription regulator
MNKKYIVSVKIKESFFALAKIPNKDWNLRIKSFVSFIPRTDRRLLVMHHHIKETYPNTVSYTEMVFNTNDVHIAQRIKENLKLNMAQCQLNGKIETFRKTDKGWKVLNISNTVSRILDKKSQEIMLTNSQPRPQDMVH